MIELAKAFENTTLSRKDATMKFGSEGTIAHFTKNKGFKETRHEEPLIKNLNQLFKSVQKVKRSNRVYYELGEARMEPAPRTDKRINNSGNELSYTKYLDAIVLMALDNNMFKGNYETTLNNWVYLFGLVNKAFFILKTAPQSKEALEIRAELRALETVTNSSLSHELGDFMTDYDDKKRILDNTLTKLSKNNLIKYYEVPKAVVKKEVFVKDEDGNLDVETSYTTLTLETETAQMIVAKQALLREKYGVTPYQLKNPNNQPKEVKDRLEYYHDELYVFYKDEIFVNLGGKSVEHVEIEFFYFAHAIYIKATKERVENYLRKNRPEFYESYIENKHNLLEYVQKEYTQERRAVLLGKAYKKAEKEYRKILENNNNDFGLRVEKELDKLLRVWDKDSKYGYCNNMRVIEEKLRADLLPTLNKTTYYPKWDATALNQNTKHLDS